MQVIQDFFLKNETVIDVSSILFLIGLFWKGLFSLRAVDRSWYEWFLTALFWGGTAFSTVLAAWMHLNEMYAFAYTFYLVTILAAIGTALAGLVHGFILVRARLSPHV